MVGELIDLGSLASQPLRDPTPPQGLTDDTLHDMVLLCEEVSLMPVQNTTDSPVMESQARQPVLGTIEYLATALSTRTEDAVIADLRRSRSRTNRADTKTCTEGKGTPKPQLSTDESPDDNRISDNEEVHGEDGEAETIPSIKPRKITQRKKDAKVSFDFWLEDYMKQQNKTNTSARNKIDEVQPTRWLFKHSENQNIISSPREYQVELFEKAKTQNIIAVLETGSGKTLIAVLLLRYILEQELADRELGKPKRVAFFLVDSVQLVFQQFAVLECNLSQQMDRFCGQMGCDLWSVDLWEKICEENMVIVCTAEVLRHCLHHSFISMDRINLLIFDEAHHAKKDHPYARIIKDFYTTKEDHSKRPKIFGMTASPVDARVDVQTAATELEAILHCQICTASDTSLLQYARPSKSEEVAEYAPLREPFETTLYSRIKTSIAGCEVFAKLLRYGKEASCELGPWCADNLWSLSLTEEEMAGLEAKTQRKFEALKVAKPQEVLDAQIKKLHDAQAIAKSHVFSEPQPTLEHLSSKVLKLMQYLQERFERQTDAKCIVFVKQRYTARLLCKLFTHPNIGTPYLRVGSLVGGANQSDVGDLKASFRQQVLTLMNFRKGNLNCLFATSVAEEGLDIPDCNLIIRFDLYTTLIQYIQSRGRARLPNSKYIHMIEHGNGAHCAMVREVIRCEDILRQFCKSLPEDRLRTGNDLDMDEILGKEKRQPVYTDPKTGAKLTYKMSLVILANFVASLPSDSETSHVPEYVILSQNKQFICEVTLPETSPIRGATGRPCSSKQVAKCSAAFEACVLLRKGKYLNEHLLSTFVKQLPIMRNAQLAVSSKKQEVYNMRTKPELWTVNEVPFELYLTIFVITNPLNLGRPSQPLGLLTRTVLPQLPWFPLFFGDRKSSQVQARPLLASIQVDGKNLAKINTFTLRIFDDVFSKRYETDLLRMPYFIAPIKSMDTTGRLPRDLVDWDILDYVHAHEQLYWDHDTPDSFFEDRYIVDPFDGSRKLWSHHVIREYKPLDPVPPNTAPRRRARTNNDNILEYSCSLWDRSRKRRTFKEDQPVLLAEYIPLSRNFLDDGDYILSEAPTKCFIVPEPLKISALPTKVVAMAYIFPSMIHRVESYLIALEACNMLHLPLPPGLALEAMTKDSDNTEDQGAVKVHFQRGMGKNYERLEFLGDCFLKMATSISVFTLHSNGNEFDYHVKRMLMICNKNLFNNACKLKLYEYIRSQSFNRRAWYPGGLVMIKGKKAAAPTTHNLSDKTIADVCEALIGAAFLNQHGMYDVDMAVRAVTELVCSTDHTMISYKDYYKHYEKPKYQTAPTTAGQRDLAKQVEQKHAYQFKYPRLLRSAFLHPSYPFLYEKVPCYQRLEFLGDSLLDMACINFLFHRFPDQNPQWLTEHKMAMVSNQFYGTLCVSLGFHRHLLHMSPIIQKNIRDFVDDMDEARLEAEEEALRAGKPRSHFSRDFWVHTKQPPKCLPDMLEAYIGAIFVDSEYNYAEVERFFKQHVQPYFEDMALYDTFANKHPATFLQNLMNISMGCNNWNLHARAIDDVSHGLVPQVVATVMVHNRVIASHQGTSGRYAKMSAAKKALEKLTGLPPVEFREVYRCDCKLTEAEEERREEGESFDGTAV